MTRDDLGREITTFWRLYLAAAGSAFFIGVLAGWLLFFLWAT